jgi:ribose-phosphate pyrophosphokinase
MSKIGILNLVHLEQSHIQYKVSSFPDGQHSVTIQTDYYGEDLSDVFTGGVEILTRLTSFTDLEILLCATQALREAGIKDIEVFITYFLGARSDRKFGPGTCNYLKTVICPIINSQKYNKVYVLDPHSDVLEGCLNNFSKADQSQIVVSAIKHLFDLDKDYVIISPDAGALKKIYDIASYLNYEDDIIVASKHRDIKTGQIVDTHVPLTGQHVNKDFVIFDDICDGGRTFIEIAKKIKEQEMTGKIYLVVTHGIFSAGLSVLAEHFDGVVCTNSYSDMTKEKIGFIGFGKEDTFIKQINVI